MKKRLAIPSGYPLPKWVEFFSYLFLVFLASPTCFIALRIWSEDLWMSAFGLKVHAQGHFLIYAFLVLLPFFGGIAAVGLLRRQPWGLVLGACYSVVAAAVCCVSLFIGYTSGLKDHPAYVELLLVVLFLRWLLRTMAGSNQSDPGDAGLRHSPCSGPVPRRA
jgi:hypothetical protein